MNLLPTTEQEQIRDAIVAFVGTELAVSRLHAADKTRAAVERKLWTQIAELGWFGLGLAEDLGGVGYGAAEDVLLFRECGRHLVSPVVLAGRLGAEAAARAGATVLAGDILAGRRQVSLANVVGVAGAFPAGPVRLQLLDAAPGDVVLAWTTAGVALFDWGDLALSPAGSGIDPTLGVTLAEAPGGGQVAWLPADEHPLAALATALLAAMLAGIAEATRDAAVAYAGLREQFGRKIGSFQAIQHHCANMSMAAECAWAQTVVAGLSWEMRRSDYRSQVAAAQLLATEAAVGNARLCIQIHGGMGFSSECDAHLFLKRSHALGVLCGPAREAWLALAAPGGDAFKFAAE